MSEKQETTDWVPIEGWRTVRQGGATDLLDSTGKRVAWITSTREVWVERPLSAGMLASVAEWAARGG